MKYWNYWLLFLVVLAVIGMVVFKKIEAFEGHYPGYNVTMNYENASSRIEDRHPIHSSLIQDLNFRYKKAYNYELENKEYQHALNKTFQLGQTCLVKQDYGVMVDGERVSNAYTPEQPMERVLPSSIQQAYQKATEIIQQMMKVSPHFELPDGQNQSLNPIQMVHDRLVGYQIHRTIPEHYLLYIEAIFYREAKYHGKHVKFIVLAEKRKQWNIQVLDASIKGIVMEDQITMFPVLGNDKLQTNQDLSTF